MPLLVVVLWFGGSEALDIWLAKLTRCLALLERQWALATVVTKAESYERVYKEGGSSWKLELYKQYNQAVATPSNYIDSEC